MNRNFGFLVLDVEVGVQHITKVRIGLGDVHWRCKDMAGWICDWLSVSDKHWWLSSLRDVKFSILLKKHWRKGCANISVKMFCSVIKDDIQIRSSQMWNKRNMIVCHPLVLNRSYVKNRTKIGVECILITSLNVVSLEIILNYSCKPSERICMSAGSCSVPIILNLLDRWKDERLLTCVSCICGNPCISLSIWPLNIRMFDQLLKTFSSDLIIEKERELLTSCWNKDLFNGLNVG